MNVALKVCAAAVGVVALAAGSFAVLTSSGTSAHAKMQTAMGAMAPKVSVHDGYAFATYDNNGDKAFNQLLGINDNDEIAGYFGSGAQGSPNKGYTLVPPYNQASYTAENFPGSAQTQVVGLNNSGVTVGFLASKNTKSMNNPNFGFYQVNGKFHRADFPTGDPASPPVDQLLGVNGHNVAVGFYIDGHGFNRGYTYDINTHAYAQVQEPGHPGASITPTGINLAGFITGFYATNKTSESFILKGTSFKTLKFPGSSSTMAFGISDSSEVVGAYTTGSGKNQVMHGFTWSKKNGYQTVDDPAGVGSTTINGVNSAGDLVGFYSTNNGNVTKGFLAIPAKTESKNLTLKAMPAGSLTLGQDSMGHLTITSNLFGLTPGSAHTLLLVGPSGTTFKATLGTLTANATGNITGTLDTNEGVKILEGSVLTLLNGTDGSAVGNEPIAKSGGIDGDLTYKLTSVEIDSSAKNWGTPAGSAKVVYDPAAQTLTISVQASDLTPGAHAAHVHVGSCMSQGGVLYMLQDLVANSSGKISATRVLTGVNAPLPAAGWYLNLHQGNSNNILSNGAPTINFRPLLCSAI
jgi:hypothetical protein